MSVPRLIAVGYDGSADSVAALRWGAEIASTIGARLRIVHAVGLLEHAGLSGRCSPHEQAATDVACRVGLDIAQVEWRVRDGEPAAVLRRETLGDDAADLLVVGTRGAGAHGGGTLGSTSLDLAQTATVPVVVVAG